jgi:hypothetical protein
VDNVTYDAYVREKEVARQEYTEAVRQGRTAGHVAMRYVTSSVSCCKHGNQHESAVKGSEFLDGLYSYQLIDEFIIYCVQTD